MQKYYLKNVNDEYLEADGRRMFVEIPESEDTGDVIFHEDFDHGQFVADIDGESPAVGSGVWDRNNSDGVIESHEGVGIAHPGNWVSYLIDGGNAPEAFFEFDLFYTEDLPGQWFGIDFLLSGDVNSRNGGSYWRWLWDPNATEWQLRRDGETGENDEHIVYQNSSIGIGDRNLWAFDTQGSTIEIYHDNTLLHEYTKQSGDPDGSYIRTYWFRSGGNNQAMRAYDIKIIADRLSADFSWSPESPMVNETIQFTDESTGDISSWFWDFDDGNTSSSQNPTHSYSEGGTYDVLLEITESGSTKTDTIVQTVSVFE